jgi:hypothetical protein
MSDHSQLIRILRAHQRIARVKQAEAELSKRCSGSADRSVLSAELSLSRETIDDLLRQRRA